MEQILVVYSLVKETATDELSIAVHAFTRRIITSLSVDEILLPRYVNLYTNFRGQPL